MTASNYRTLAPTAVEVRWEPVAQLVPALAAVVTEAEDQLGARYPRALREEGRALALAAFPDDELPSLAAEVARLGMNRVVAAAITRDLSNGPADDASALAHRIAEIADLSAVPGPVPGTAERLSAMHRASRFDAAPIVPPEQSVLLHPVRLLPPAPAGKLFARNVPGGQPLRMAFGDTGHVNADTTLDWLQWYRLGVWHATLNKGWAAAVAAASSPELDAAFGELPKEQLRKAGVHEAVVHSFTSWSAYFLDGLVAAGKIVSERGVAGPTGGAEQQRWLRALGRTHIDWFVEQLAGCGVAEHGSAGVRVDRLAARWLADHAELAALEPRFDGPLAACESPLWSDAAEVFFSPSVPRAARRSLNLWLRGQWPGQVVASAAETLPAVPTGPRLVFALAEDSEWLDTLARDVQPASQQRWRTKCGADASDSGLLYGYRHHAAPLTWSRVSVAGTVDGLARLQQARRAFSDWTALTPGGGTVSGDLDYDPQGRLGLPA